MAKVLLCCGEHGTNEGDIIAKFETSKEFNPNEVACCDVWQVNETVEEINAIEASLRPDMSGWTLKQIFSYNKSSKYEFRVTDHEGSSIAGKMVLNRSLP